MFNTFNTTDPVKKVGTPTGTPTGVQPVAAPITPAAPYRQKQEKYLVLIQPQEIEEL
jgi:hypothetical protein